jgi:hypothetical protein
MELFGMMKDPSKLADSVAFRSAGILDSESFTPKDEMGTQALDFDEGSGANQGQFKTENLDDPDDV